jgi:alkyl hydroperoxide reductase subunit AhpF
VGFVLNEKAPMLLSTHNKKKYMTYDLAILGGGPAGVSAGVYAARKRLKTLFITDSWGGQSIVSEGIENWIGTPSITGNDLAKNLKTHLSSYAGDILTINEGERATSLSQNEDKTFTITTSKGNYQAKTALIATGSTRRKLEIPGAVEFENKGITYCASCDGPLFSGKDLSVIGGGNAAFETAAQLLAYAKSVTLLNRGTEFRADAITVEKVLANPKMKAIMNAGLVEIKGEAFVSSLVYEDMESKEKIEIPTEGIFVEIGLIPTTDFVKELIPLNKYNQIPIDPRTQATTIPGLWAAGDCTDVLYHQNNIAAGDGVRALEDIYMHIHTK